jgi:hypothetical protein
LKRRFQKDFEEYKQLCNIVSFFKKYPERDMHEDYDKYAKLFDQLAHSNKIE